MLLNNDHRSSNVALGSGCVLVPPENESEELIIPTDILSLFIQLCAVEWLYRYVHSIAQTKKK